LGYRSSDSNSPNPDGVVQALVPEEQSAPFPITGIPGLEPFITVFNQIPVVGVPENEYSIWTGNLLTFLNNASTESQSQVITLNGTSITTTLTYYLLNSVLQIEIGDFSPPFFNQVQFQTTPSQLSQTVEIGTYSQPGFNGLTIVYTSGSSTPLLGSSPVIPTPRFTPGAGGWYIKIFANWREKYYWIGDLQDFITGGSLVKQATAYPAVQSFYATMNGFGGDDTTPEELIINYYINVDRDNTLIIMIAGYQAVEIPPSLGAARRNRPRSLTRSASAYSDSGTTLKCNCRCSTHCSKTIY
jgi:hypothetical protein